MPATRPRPQFGVSGGLELIGGRLAPAHGANRLTRPGKAAVIEHSRFPPRGVSMLLCVESSLGAERLIGAYCVQLSVAVHLRPLCCLDNITDDFALALYP